MAMYEYLRSVKVKGPHGTIEIENHDGKKDGYGNSPATTKDLVDQAIELYAKVAETNRRHEDTE